MSSTKHDPLVLLTLRLQEQYQTLDRLVDSMNQSSDVSIEPMSEQVKAIKETEDQLRPLREMFRASGHELPPELNKPNNETIELLKGLMPKLAQLEKSTLESTQRLFPKIQQSVRAVQMQNAYGASRAF